MPSRIFVGFVLSTVGATAFGQIPPPPASSLNAVQQLAPKAPLEAATSSASRESDGSVFPGAPASSGRSRRLFQIQGDGVALPPGAAQGSKGQSTGDKKSSADDSASPNKGDGKIGADSRGKGPDLAGKIPTLPKDQTNPIAERMDRGLERDVGVAHPTDTRVKEGGVSLPVCTNESREGVACIQK